MTEISALSRSFTNSGIKTGFISTLDVNLNMRRALAVNYYKLGVALDLDCPESKGVLEQVRIFLRGKKKKRKRKEYNKKK